MTDISKERRDVLRAHFTKWRKESFAPIPVHDLLALLDAADRANQLTARYESPPPATGAAARRALYEAVLAANREADKRLKTLREALSKDPTDAPL